MSDTTLPTINNGTPTSLEARKAAVTDDLTHKREAADRLIRKYALFGTATGLIPTFGVDVAATVAVQTKMIKDLADIYAFDINDQLMRTAVTSGVMALGGSILTQIAAMLASTFSPLKMLLGGATSAVVAGFLTLEIGRLYQHHMELGNNPADIGVMDIVDHIAAQVQEGKWDPNQLSISKQVGALMSNN